MKQNQWRTITADGDDGPVFGEDVHSNWDHVTPNTHTMRLGGCLVPVSCELGYYQDKGIRLRNPPHVYPQELLRALTPEYREYFFASQEDLQQEFTTPIPKVLQLEEWRHPVLLENGMLEKPSQCETFKLIAKVIATCDPGQYKPSEKPNTHWSNWLLADVCL